MANGRNVYLTEKEIKALIDASTEWCEIMGSGDKESCDSVEERLNNGLGSALRKLYKGRKGERIYKDYKSV